MSIAEKYLNSGIEPIELLYQIVMSTDDAHTAAYRSLVRINSLELGVLMPEQYADIAERNALCMELFYWNFSVFCETLDREQFKNKNAQWASLHVPARALTKTDLPVKLEKMMNEKGFTHPGNICLEFSDHILFEDLNPHREKLNRLREMGFLIGMSGFGSEYCPLLKMAEFAPDYVVADEFIMRNYLEDTVGVISPALEAASACGAKIIVTGARHQMLPALARAGFWGAVGKVSGALKKKI